MRAWKDIRRNSYVRLAMLLTTILLLGTAGFMLIEGWGFVDSLYMAVTTLTTVGFGEVHPLGTGGRVFVMVYLLFGLGVFLYGVNDLGGAIIRRQRSRSMTSSVRALHGHIIVCGFGRVGRKLSAALAREGKSFAVVDRDPNALAAAEAEGWPWVRGDATEDRTLQAVGLERARGLAAVLPGDADNLYVVLSARLKRADLQILARADEEKAGEKLARAGANRIVNIYETGAHKMAQLLSNPNIEDFIEILSTRDRPLDIAQFAVPAAAPYCGRTLPESGFREKGIMVLGIAKPGGAMQIPPASSVTIAAGDRLIILGPEGAIGDSHPDDRLSAASSHLPPATGASIIAGAAGGSGKS